jgi:S1-C subfamily serine protease
VPAPKSTAARSSTATRNASRALAAAIALAASVTGPAIAAAPAAGAASPPPTAPAPAAAIAAGDIRRDATVAAVERVMPAVVNINTEEVVAIRDPFENIFREFFGPSYQRRQPNTQYSLGSGVIIDEEGYVLTNFHVVGRARRVWVTLHDGRVFEADRVVVNNALDVALIKIRAKGDEQFTAIQFAADDDLLLGETVLALGNPFGLGGSVSKGILSSKTRRPATEGRTMDVQDWLQTDAAINPGNSGGPLTNLKGELIGINVAVLSEAQGIGFAIPIKRVSEKLAEMFSPETLDGLWFGALVRPGHQRLSVSSVQPDSPADKAGLRSGDQIVQVNGATPRGYIQFVNVLRAAKDKKAVELAVQRGRERRTISVRLAPEASVFNARLVQQKTGLSVQELTPRLAQGMGLGGAAGLLIAEVEPRSPAALAEMKHGMVITAADGQPMVDVVDFAKLLHRRQPGDKTRLELLIQLQRGSYIQVREAVVELKLR